MHWRSKLRTLPADAEWSKAPQGSLDQTILEIVAAEDAAARVVEDLAPVAAIQHHVLASLRGCVSVFTASKEGRSHLFFDGTDFRQVDHGEAPSLNEIHEDDAATLASLRRLYDWDAQRETHPHRRTELGAWEHICKQLRAQ